MEPFLHLIFFIHKSYVHDFSLPFFVGKESVLYHLLGTNTSTVLKQRYKNPSPCPEKTLGSTLVHFFSLRFKALQGSPDGHPHLRVGPIITEEEEEVHFHDSLIVPCRGRSASPPARFLRLLHHLRLHIKAAAAADCVH